MPEIDQNDLQGELQRLAQEYSIYMPAETIAELNIEVPDFVYVLKYPKDMFFPQSETLYHAKRNKQKITITAEADFNEKAVLYGVKDFDIKAFEILDRVFLAEPADTYYANRRQNTTIYEFKGKAAPVPIDIALRRFGMDIFDSKVWEKMAQACLACGTCTFVCPTCQCYDIRDYDTGNGIQKYRCWDSCMYSDFTMMAHGNNRTTQAQRFRQRFMHKLVYFPDNNDGLLSCVGCGRCVTSCPANLHIYKVIKALGEENGE